MRKVVHKLIRVNRGGVNLAADVNAVISSGEGGLNVTRVRSQNRIVQQGGRTWSESKTEDLSQTDIEEDHDGKDS